LELRTVSLNKTKQGTVDKLGDYIVLVVVAANTSLLSLQPTSWQKKFGAFRGFTLSLINQK
jgi:hypothetical protein